VAGGGGISRRAVSRVGRYFTHHASGGGGDGWRAGPFTPFDNVTGLCHSLRPRSKHLVLDEEDG
jgi:hypothetical protein